MNIWIVSTLGLLWIMLLWTLVYRFLFEYAKIIDCLVLQLCLTLRDSMDCSPPGSSVHSRQEYWSGLPFPLPGDLPDPGIELMSPVPPALQADSLPTGLLGNLFLLIFKLYNMYSFCLWKVSQIKWNITQQFVRFSHTFACSNSSFFLVQSSTVCLYHNYSHILFMDINVVFRFGQVLIKDIYSFLWAIGVQLGMSSFSNYSQTVFKGSFTSLHSS